MGCVGPLRSGNPAARLRLDTDRAELAPDGCDCACVTATLLDAAGQVVPHADVPVSFAIDGPGRLLGCGNGDPLDHTPDGSPVRRTFGGRCLAVVQSGSAPGLIVVTAEADGLPAARLDLVQTSSLSMPGKPR